MEEQLNQFGRPKQRVILYKLTQQMKQEARDQLAQDKTLLSEQAYFEAEHRGQQVWDKFYKFNKCNFFRDRTYLQREMPEIGWARTMFEEEGKVSTFYQVGCGVGNALFPLLRNYPFLTFLGCDISRTAIELVQAQMAQHPQHQKRVQVAVCDLVQHQIPFAGVAQLHSLIFVLSAILPHHHRAVVAKVAAAMQPGSFLFFRDYGRYDFGQLNLASKGNRKLQDNLYVKNDGVCVYYFDEDELKALVEGVGLIVVEIRLHCKLLENRKRALKMHRVWIQGRFYKPPISQYLLKKIQQDKINKANMQQEYQNQHKEEVNLEELIEKQQKEEMNLERLIKKQQKEEMNLERLIKKQQKYKQNEQMKGHNHLQQVMKEQKKEAKQQNEK